MARKKLQGYENIKKWFVIEMTKVEKSDMTILKKNNAAKRIGTKVRDALWIKTVDTRPVKEDDKYHDQGDTEVTATSHNRYVTRMRTDIEHIGILSFTFFDDVESLISEHGKRAEELRKIDTSTASKARAGIKYLVKKAELSLSRSKREVTKKEILSYIKSLKKLEPSNPCMFALARTDAQTENMRKRTTDRKVKYQKKPRIVEVIPTLEIINVLLKKESWGELALGIALATGRRCVEVIHFGKFKKSGKSQLVFSGQRKTKIHGTTEYTIPCLVDTDLVVNALSRLRNDDRITSLISRLKSKNLHEAELARRINSSVSASLNKLIKEVFNPEQEKSSHWVFKDSRAIYARISYAQYSANAKKAGRIPSQDSIYFHDVLGHTDENENASYKQFIISDKEILNAYQLKKAKANGAKIEFANRLALLIEASESQAITERRAFTKYHGWAIEQTQSNSGFVIDTATIRKQLGGNPKIIGEYVQLIKDLKLDRENLIPLTKSKDKTPAKTVQKITRKVMVTMTVEMEVTVDYEHENDNCEINANKLCQLTESAIEGDLWELSPSDFNIEDWNITR